MATAARTLEKMREICLSLPDTREGDHFGQAAFYVKGKLRVVGVSPTGRATVAALQMNPPLILAIRAEEALLRRHPPPC